MKLSPAIRPTRYERGMEETKSIDDLSYFSFRGINWEKADEYPLTNRIGRKLLIYYGRSGTIYFTEQSAHVAMSMYRSNKLAFLREYVLDAISELNDEGILETVREIDPGV